MPTPIRMTPAQARKYSFTGEKKAEKKPQKPSKPHEVDRRLEEAAEPVSVTLGEKWRVAKGLQKVTVTPPPVGTICQVWAITRRVFLMGDGFTFDVSIEQLAQYFSLENEIEKQTNEE